MMSLMFYGTQASAGVGGPSILQTWWYTTDACSKWWNMVKDLVSACEISLRNSQKFSWEGETTTKIWIVIVNMSH